MLRAQIVIKDGGIRKIIEEMFLAERPLLGSEIGDKYKAISISNLVMMGTNISVGEPVMGIRICVEKL